MKEPLPQVNKRAVRILLECILVIIMYCFDKVFVYFSLKLHLFFSWFLFRWKINSINFYRTLSVCLVLYEEDTVSFKNLSNKNAFR